MLLIWWTHEQLSNGFNWSWSGLIILQSKFVQSIQSFEKICFYNYYKVFSEGMLSD